MSNISGGSSCRAQMLSSEEYLCYQVLGDIHEEVENHNRLLDRMGHNMDASRGVLSGTMDRFKTVFETKSGRRMAVFVALFLAFFLFIYYLTK